MPSRDEDRVATNGERAPAVDTQHLTCHPAGDRAERRRVAAPFLIADFEAAAGIEPV